MRFLEDGHGQILYRIRSLIREQPKILRPFCPQLPRLAQQAAARIRILLTSAAVDTSKARDRGDSLIDALEETGDNVAQIANDEDAWLLFAQ